MSAGVKIIGSIFLSYIIYSVPILTTCSFVYDWNGTILFLFTFASFMELLHLVAFIYDKVEEGE